METKITLSAPIKVAGTDVSVLTMRAPRVKDTLAMRTYQKSGKRDDSEAEIFILALLCGLAPDDLSDLLMVDYGKLQAAYLDFVNGPAGT